MSLSALCTEVTSGPVEMTSPTQPEQAVSIAAGTQGLIQLGLSISDIALLIDQGKKMGNFLRAGQNDNDLFDVLGEAKEAVFKRSDLVDAREMEKRWPMMNFVHQGVRVKGKIVQSLQAHSSTQESNHRRNMGSTQDGVDSFTWVMVAITSALDECAPSHHIRELLIRVFVEVLEGNEGIAHALRVHIKRNIESWRSFGCAREIAFSIKKQIRKAFSKSVPDELQILAVPQINEAETEDMKNMLVWLLRGDLTVFYAMSPIVFAVAEAWKRVGLDLCTDGNPVRESQACVRYSTSGALSPSYVKQAVAPTKDEYEALVRSESGELKIGCSSSVRNVDQQHARDSEVEDSSASFSADDTHDYGKESFRTRQSLSTRPTTVTDRRSAKVPAHSAAITENQIIEEHKIERDTNSTISGGSVVFRDPEERNMIVQSFTNAILKDLPSRCLQTHERPLEDPAFRQLFSSYMKEYTKSVRSSISQGTRMNQAAKAIRQLRADIWRKILQDLGGFTGVEENEKILPSILNHLKESGDQEATWLDKVNGWNASFVGIDSVGVPIATEDFSDAISSSSLEESSGNRYTADLADHSNMTNVGDEAIYSYLIRHEAFATLSQQLQKLVEQRFGNQAEIMRYRVALALHRPGVFEKAANESFVASFRTEWDVVGFLKNQYESGVLQPLNHVLAITGGVENAQLTTVEEYLRQVWPEGEHTFALVDAINLTLRQNSSNKNSSNLIASQGIQFDPIEQIVTVQGSESYIVAVAQQLAWLGAACRESVGRLASCYTMVSERADSAHEFPGPLFDISYEVSSSVGDASPSCWHDLVGNSVVAIGYPIRPREHDEIGLQTSIEIMAALAKVPLATNFGGGYVLKGRSFVIAPLGKKGSSVQWHLFQNPGRSRLRFTDLRVLCPDRLSIDDLDEEGMKSSVCYLGWCPRSRNYLATTEYDYEAIHYSPTPLLAKRTFSITGATIGFSQIGTGGLNLTLGRKDGYYHNQAAEFYEDMLDDAAQIRVVLQDAQDRRAWLADAERVILHMIVHRHGTQPFRRRNQLADPDDPSSIRAAMIANTDIVMKDDRKMETSNATSKRFQDVVGELFAFFEGLMEFQEELNNSPGLELNFDRGSEVFGWEYLDIVNRKLHPHPRRTQLRITCGKWPKLMRELGAVVLFGLCFQEVIRPIANGRLCSGFQCLPKGKDLLAMEACMLQEMYRESGSSEENEVAQMTLAGTHLRRSSHLFDSCQKVQEQNEGKIQSCRCKRIQKIIWKKGGSRITKRMSGAIIIGKASSRWTALFGNGAPARTSSQPQNLKQRRTSRSLSTVGQIPQSYKAPVSAASEPESSRRLTVPFYGSLPSVSNIVASENVNEQLNCDYIRSATSQKRKQVPIGDIQ